MSATSNARASSAPRGARRSAAAGSSPRGRAPGPARSVRRPPSTTAPRRHEAANLCGQPHRGAVRGVRILHGGAGLIASASGSDVGKSRYQRAQRVHGVAGRQCCASVAASPPVAERADGEVRLEIAQFGARREAPVPEQVADLLESSPRVRGRGCRRPAVGQHPLLRHRCDRSPTRWPPPLRDPPFGAVRGRLLGKVGRRRSARMNVRVLRAGRVS